MSFESMFLLSNNHPEDDETDSESDSEDEDSSGLIDDLVEKARSNVIPEKSRKLYEKQYEKYLAWRKKMKLVGKTTQSHLLAYFQKLSETYAPTTLWATYTKLRSMLSWKESQDVSKFLELQCFLKSKGKRHTPKKAMVFTTSEISTFINNASDDEFLLHKVVLVIGLHGCLRSMELINLTINDVKEEGMLYHFKILKTKTGISKSFVTSPEVHPIISKYIKLRPKEMERFFVQYRNKICTRQNVGKGKLSSIPKDIAKHLELEQPNRYTGHALRRTSATIAADNGADLITLKRLGGWKSSTVAESYVNESVLNQKNTSHIISSALNIKKPEEKSKTATAIGLEIKKPQNLVKPSISHQNDMNGNDDNMDYLDDLLTITQEEYDDVLQSDFISNEKMQKVPDNPEFEKCQNNSRQPLSALKDNLDNVINTHFVLSQEELVSCQITSEACEELFATEIQIEKQPEKKKKLNDEQSNKHNVGSMNLFGKKDKENAVYIFKNCHFIINNS